jgi:hypothetical protein
MRLSVSPMLLVILPWLPTSGGAQVFPSFVADVYGSYVVQLVVSDNWASSAPDTVTVGFENLKPVADAGPVGLPTWPLSSPWMGARASIPTATR